MEAPQVLKAEAYKEGQWWMVSIPEIDALTQSRTMRGVPVMAEDLAAIVLDVPVGQVDVAIAYVTAGRPAAS